MSAEEPKANGTGEGGDNAQEDTGAESYFLGAAKSSSVPQEEIVFGQDSSKDVLSAVNEEGNQLPSKSEGVSGQGPNSSSTLSGRNSSMSSRNSLAARFFKATASTAGKIGLARGASSLTTDSVESEGVTKRPTHLRKLFLRRKQKDKYMEKSTKALGLLVQQAEAGDTDDEMQLDFVSLDEAGEIDEHTKELTNKIRKINEMFKEWIEVSGGKTFDLPLEVRMEDFSYSVMLQPGANKVKTVFNSSFLYSLKKFYKKHVTKEEEKMEAPTKKVILDNINLVIEPSKSYLVLGPPQSGKTSLLRAISGHVKPSKRARQNKNQSIEGKILYNGKLLEEGGEDFFIENAVEYIDQLDRHAPRLTVEETFEFAYQCKAGGTLLREKHWLENEKQVEVVEKGDREHLRVKAALVGLGLDEVKDTFVGDTNVRGVSGGQRRRVTVGEFLQERCPVLCGDEISTGLDAKSTYETVELLLHFSKASNSARVISLLQPSPETVSLFDEVILLSGGRIIYSGPIQEVEEYFRGLGFKQPGHIDVADFLQQVSNEDGEQFFVPTSERPNMPSPDELAKAFHESEWGLRVMRKISAEHKYTWAVQKNETGSFRKSGEGSLVTEMAAVKSRYANGAIKSSYLNLCRFLTLWRRDKRVIIAGAAKNILMGVSVGGVFFNTTEEIDLTGALFQAGLFIMLGAMQNASGLIVDRPIFKKHYEANFYSAMPFVIGRTLSSVPQTISDVVLFGTILYYFIGLAGRDEAGNFFIYLSVLIAFAFTMQQQLALFASFSSTSGLQVLSAITLLFFILFGGFIVAPNAIPSFYWWAYWLSPYGWAYRALVVNEFRSSRWEDPDEILVRLGFTLPNSEEAFGKEWIGWSFLYMILYFVLCTVLCAFGLTKAGEKVVTKTLQFDDDEDNENPDESSAAARPELEVPFIPVTMSFHDICYDVSASTGSNKLRLLNNVNGLFRPGRMVALMGTSGAGKTTLMDVLALRKRTGEISGDIRLNGWPQDPISFRRASGYVEQFDVQSPELTVKETVLFSARLRLQQDLIEEEADVDAFVDRVLEAVELQHLHRALVGTDDGMGLSFEQKKLLSIAVELAASPSIIFLDEPTSGLDSRSAMKVVKTLRKISDQNRTICATIHQPSSAVFDMFNDLLLLKKGGNVVFHGELGDRSSNLVEYLESEGAPKMEYGENPANWMLNVMALDHLEDLDQRWLKSKQFEKMKHELASIYTNRPDDATKIQFDEEFAASRGKRRSLITKRLRLIYWRSPNYNLARMTVSALIAFILGSVFIVKRSQTRYSETDFRARLSVVFLTFIITGIMAILSTIPVMTKIRDMYYRHRASSSYDSLSIGWALGSAEKLFIVLASFIFCVIFQLTASMNDSIYRGMIGFWGFFCFNFAIYSYFGQAFVAMVEPSATAIILSSVFIGLNNFFAGLIVRPQLMVGGFYALPYYICPGHYVYEGLVVSLYRDDESVVIADEGSDFWDDLGCTPQMTSVCSGSVNEYIRVFFGGDFGEDHIARNTIILGFILVITRLLTWLALKYIRFG
eukprot:CAMPEP_0172455684 /NCGR_PEP_ID=MMETSP1065-20121228/12192_1 /TAXON_ID=265537 /ORGANISM="Amphiprora paludosa, Strain CCMP125" /LENGTH=1539 /DNA_ID=CAMNT_0013208153 /DNA_START=180 /DNA_END=4799 /DNA_ORIENTATION=-